jgi:hypothetical protein
LHGLKLAEVLDMGRSYQDQKRVQLFATQRMMVNRNASCEGVVDETTVGVVVGPVHADRDERLGLTITCIDGMEAGA